MEQIAWVTLPLRGVGEQALLQRRFEYRNLLKQVPAVTDIREMSRVGVEELLVPRTELDVIASGTAYSSHAGFSAARAGERPFGPGDLRTGTQP